MSVMQFELTADESDLRDAVRRLMRTHADSAHLRAHLDPSGDHDPALWSRVARDMGLAGLTIDEKFGGSGATATELAVVMHEMGRVLAAVPYFSTVVLAATAIGFSDDETAKERWLPRIAEGATTAALAHVDSGVPVVATRGPDGWSLSGTKHRVIHGAQADLLVVSARTVEGESAVFVVPCDSPMIHVRRPEALDLTRPLAEISFAGTRAELLGSVGDGDRIVQDTLDWAAIALGAEMVGVAEAAMEMAVEYAKVRVAFDRPIGSFQAVKHKLANMYVDLELSRGVVRHAALSAAADPDSVATNADLVLAQTSDGCFRTVADLLQIMGGIGYTWEHDAHLYFKRGRSSGYLLGTAAEHRAAVARQFGL
jgi:alkylation response protein AidB-like acyl-CoA dehydrogenase